MPILTLVRGLPGSGKSTYAYKHVEAFLLEADQFFVDMVGNYAFDGRLLKIAHEWCYSQTVLLLRRKKDVVVCNTFTQLWEINRYLEIPNLLTDVEIHIVEMRTQYQNVHGVPEEKLKQMAARWEDISMYPSVQPHNIKVIE